MDWFKYARSTVVVFFLLPVVLFAQIERGSRVIVIDPGHGGIDPGAIGNSGIEEKDIVLEVAKEILLLNKDMDKQIYLTRYTDTLVSLNDRVKLAKALKSDLFISLHCNHASNPMARGIEIFVAAGELTGQTLSAVYFAYQLHRTITNATEIKARGVKFANFQVLKETIPHLPSILIELCFISNLDEENFISNKNNLKAMASLIFNSL